MWVGLVKQSQDWFLHSQHSQIEKFFLLRFKCVLKRFIGFVTFLRIFNFWIIKFYAFESIYLVERKSEWLDESMSVQFWTIIIRDTRISKVIKLRFYPKKLPQTKLQWMLSWLSHQDCSRTMKLEICKKSSPKMNKKIFLRGHW